MSRCTSCAGVSSEPRILGTNLRRKRKLVILHGDPARKKGRAPTGSEVAGNVSIRAELCSGNGNGLFALGPRGRGEHTQAAVL